MEVKVESHSHIHTYGEWVVRPGAASSFIPIWTEFAGWMEHHQKGFKNGALMQDSENPNLFISSGTWDSMEDIEQWRGTQEFQDFVGKTMPFLIEFKPHAMKSVANFQKR